MANFDTLSREQMIELINVQSMNLKENSDRIKSLEDLIKKSMSFQGTESGVKRKCVKPVSKSPRKDNIRRKINELESRYTDLQKERSCIIAFNKKK